MLDERKLQMDVQRFDYPGPPEVADRKRLVTLGRTETLYGSVQVIPGGWTGRLHRHQGTDGFWYVLSGEARFVGPDGSAYAELGSRDGVFVKRGTTYQVVNTGADVLELLHVSATVPGYDVETDYEALDEQP
jgi:mannose-6-phosphate isomerase-like protein (cupin superfamily)